MCVCRSLCQNLVHHFLFRDAVIVQCYGKGSEAVCPVLDLFQQFSFGFEGVIGNIPVPSENTLFRDAHVCSNITMSSSLCLCVMAKLVVSLETWMDQLTSGQRHFELHQLEMEDIH